MSGEGIDTKDFKKFSLIDETESVASDSTNGETLVSSSDYARLEEKYNHVVKYTAELVDDYNNLKKAFEEVIDNYACEKHTILTRKNALKMYWRTKAGLSDK